MERHSQCRLCVSAIVSSTSSTCSRLPAADQWRHLRQRTTRHAQRSHPLTSRPGSEHRGVGKEGGAGKGKGEEERRRGGREMGGGGGAGEGERRGRRGEVREEGE